MKNFRNIINIILLLFSSIILMLISWYKVYFSEIGLEQLLFHLMVPLEGTDSNVFKEFFIYSNFYIMLTVVILIIVSIYQSRLFRHQYSIIINTKFINKTKNLIWKIKDDRNYLFVFTLLIFISTIVYSFQTLEVKAYIMNNLHDSKIIEEYYVDPRNVELTFPKQKQNLIYIYLESMESTYSNMEAKYVNESNLIPNLTSYATNNINFSSNDTVGGALPIYGTGWTIAGMVAQTAGIPIKIPIDGNSLGNYESFLPGAYSLGEILEKEGYNELVLFGSEGSFGGRDSYFLQHGNYKIYDYQSAIENEIIPDDYFVNWGIEDLKLFEIAQEEITKLSKFDEPFYFTMLTADTHFPYGYQDETCGIGKTDSLYANSVMCSDQKVADFIKWIKKQDFYKNTTIIISGDHLLMGNYLYTDAIIDGRTIYNVIINSKVTTDNTKNRIFTTMDMYPTTLASLGVEIKGDRLGLGTNLFSNKPTLPEEIGYDYLNEELEKKSSYYNKHILAKE